MSDTFIGEKKLINAAIYPRHGNDWYIESSTASEMLFANETFNGNIHDPACGIGRIVKSACAAGYIATGTDVVSRTEAPWHLGIIDFMRDTPDFPIDNVVCNPPFGYQNAGTELFTRRALSIAKRKVAIFARMEFLWGERRASGLFREHTPSTIYILTPRQHCLPGPMILAGERAAGGMKDYLWLVFDREDKEPQARVKWITPN